MMAAQHIQSVDTETISRVAAATVNVAAAYQAYRARQVFSSRYFPHLLFIAFWTLMLGLGMMSLAFRWDAEYLIESLNISAICSIGGWGALVFRIQHHSVSVHKLRDLAARIEAEEGVRVSPHIDSEVE